LLRFIARRLVLLVPILLGTSAAVFLFVRALPGGPAIALLGERATPEAVAAFEAAVGLDQPVWRQFGTYLSNVLSGDLGQSVRTRQPVVDELIQRFPATFELSLAAIFVAIVVGVPLGYVAAKRYQGALDQVSLVGSLLGISFPVFFLALLLKYLFSVRLGWLPSVGRVDITSSFEPRTGFYVLDAIVAGNTAALFDVLSHLVLPAIALGTIPLAIIARITRAATLDVLGEDYVRTARAKGLRESVVDRRHVLSNALLPVVTVVGLQTGLLLTGAVLTETVFAWPGVGSWIIEAIRNRDYAVLQGGILFFVLIVIVTNLLVDLSYALLNPRIRYSS
jgi:peptide/nickel transport system permease protein